MHIRTPLQCNCRNEQLITHTHAQRERERDRKQSSNSLHATRLFMVHSHALCAGMRRDGLCCALRGDAVFSSRTWIFMCIEWRKVRTTTRWYYQKIRNELMHINLCWSLIGSSLLVLARWWKHEKRFYQRRGAQRCTTWECECPITIYTLNDRLQYRDARVYTCTR